MTDLCTCNLEQAFSCAEYYGDDYPSDHWEVFDAECVRVAICPNERYAKMLVFALDNLNDYRGRACEVHHEEQIL